MATVNTVVTVKADDWDENEAVRSTIAGAQVYLARNPRAKAKRLALVSVPRSSYRNAKTSLTFRLEEIIVRVPADS